MVEIPSGEVVISKKIGPWSSTGGANSFSLAIDTENMLAITSISGGFSQVDNTQKYRYWTADNYQVCETGSVHAIDLRTGFTVADCESIWKKHAENGTVCDDQDYDDYVDISWVNMSLCERARNGTQMLPANETCEEVCDLCGY